MQPYLRSSSLSQEETGILTSFRSQCTRGIRNNFRKMYQNLNCPLKCYHENQIDDQDHILKCQKLNTKQTKVVLENIFGCLQDQVKIAKTLANLMRKRNQLLEVETQCLIADNSA